MTETQHNLRWNIGYAPQAKSAFDQRVRPAVNEAVRAGHGVLFHCRKGRHRSALAAAVALMVGLGYQFDEAARMVQDARPCAQVWRAYSTGTAQRWIQLIQREHQ